MLGLFRFIYRKTTPVYRKNHFNELSNQKNSNLSKVGHLFAGAIESIPLFGFLGGAIEWGLRLAGVVKDTAKKTNKVVKDALSPEQESEKMQKNLGKAIEEHKEKNPDAAHLIPTLEEVQSSVALNEDLKLSKTEHAEDVGNRAPPIEDSHIIADIEKGSVLGVLDGHGGWRVSDYVSKEFPTIFSEKLAKKTVREAFTSTLEDLQENIRNRGWNRGGSTAVVSFIEKGKINTATLGDSEVFVFRVMNGVLKCIPLSAVRDWTSDKDEKRKNENQEKLGVDRTAHKNPKGIRYPEKGIGVNVSRSLGDVYIEEAEKNAALKKGVTIEKGVSIKPKITEALLQEGDIILHVCDGVTDFLKLSELIHIVKDWKEGGKETGLPETLIKIIKEKNKGKQLDNITVLATVVQLL